ncbi:MAG: FKBP-type peptidyl-prolyl cis-trans isomerase [Candidatus Kapabacteria bacterium]|nr:FKBP-type peptidyl-prolyl cis-trans isomerase [Candidatus Kapabacteria bacterium]
MTPNGVKDTDKSVCATKRLPTISQNLPFNTSPKMETITTSSGLQYIDTEIGTGASPERGQRVTVHYTGTLENGMKFDSSLDRNEPFAFKIGIGQVIEGWDEGVATMKIGGKRRLIIPGNLGYGRQGVPGLIPANATLIFDVELLKISQ